MMREGGGGTRDDVGGGGGTGAQGVTSKAPKSAS